MPRTLNIFVCGPTVYDYIHLGNARTFVIFDAFVKWLRHRGHDVRYIQNITDIDDKIIARAGEQGSDPAQFAREWEQKFYEDTRALGITSPEYHRAMDHVPEIRDQVRRLIKKGNVYELSDGWYFDLSTFPDYGKLSGRTKLQDEDAVSRVDENPDKRHTGDFCVWKGSLEAGRPGWHIEDTAITEKYFGPQYDIHGGGADLKFPHHEAEIAIMESISGMKPFVKTWMHAGFLVNKGKRMGKSNANFMTAHEALQVYPAEALRFYFLGAHYCSPLDYTEQNLKAAEAAVARIGEFLAKLERFGDELPREANPAIASAMARAQTEFEAALDNDFNTPKALGALFELIKELNPLIGSRTLDQESARKIQDFFKTIGDTLGIVSRLNLDVPKTVAMLIDQRERARQDKNYEFADRLRRQIESSGYQVDDTAYGPLVKRS